MVTIAQQKLRSLMEDVMIGCGRWIEAIIIVSKDGSPMAYSANIDLEPDYIAAATSSIAGVTSSVLELLDSRGFDGIDIRLKEDRYLLLRSYESHYVVALTKPNPNLGFVNLVLDACLSSENEDV
ncbi:MAG: hypothetical protein DRN54_00495 [Thaumarchaeota archaeon]|nr:MAG: hypothetical protein DRN54_00495 [Nitrososphaerota archaeon]